MIGVLGGTFDPVHHGHLRLALDAAERLDLSSVRLVVSPRPPLRNPPVAAPEDRAEMLRIAIAGCGRLALDLREFGRDGPSYMVETLAALAGEFTEPLCLLLGLDAFARLPEWWRWESLAEHAHIAVFGRPGARREFGADLVRWIEGRQVSDPGEMQRSRAGQVVFLDGRLLDISASEIRQRLRDGRDPRWLLPDAVLDRIRERGLYAIPEGSTWQ